MSHATVIFKIYRKLIWRIGTEQHRAIVSKIDFKKKRKKNQYVCGWRAILLPFNAHWLFKRKEKIRTIPRLVCDISFEISLPHSLTSSECRCRRLHHHPYLFTCSSDAHFEIMPLSECKKKQIANALSTLNIWINELDLVSFFFSSTIVFRLKWAIHKLFQFPIVIIHRPNNHKLSRFLCMVRCSLFIRF